MFSVHTHTNTEGVSKKEGIPDDTDGKNVNAWLTAAPAAIAVKYITYAYP